MKSARRFLVAAAVLGGSLWLPGAAAEAAVGAYATGNVNMRACGSTRCQRITTIPAGAPVTVYGCTEGYRWCDAQYGGYRGWVSGRYLQAMAPGYAQASPLPAIGAVLGIAILGAALADNYYPYWGSGWGPGYWGPGYWRPGWGPGYRPGWRYPPYVGPPGNPRPPTGGMPGRGPSFGMPRGGGMPSMGGMPGGGMGIPMPGGMPGGGGAR